MTQPAVLSAEKMKAVIFLFLTAFFLHSNASSLYAEAPNKEGAISPGGLNKSYPLQPGDKISIKIYPEDEFIKGGETEVSSEGTVTLPLIGKVPVVQKTVQEAEHAVAALLEQDYLVDPQVVIEVLKYQSGNFVVLGQVMKPGTYTFKPGAMNVTLLEAISTAGGFSEIANIKKIKIRRKTTGEVLDVNAEEIISGRRPDLLINADDVVHVSESLF